MKQNQDALNLRGFQGSCDKTFVALAAPSLEGKTQSAFNLRSVNPLYFVVFAADDQSGNIQKIYRSFQKHSEFLKMFACDDLKTTGVRLAPSATELQSSKFADKPLYVLGFFYEIILRTIDERPRRGSDSNFAQLPQ